jgi:hypothetical protein
MCHAPPYSKPRVAHLHFQDTRREKKKRTKFPELDKPLVIPVKFPLLEYHGFEVMKKDA